MTADDEAPPEAAHFVVSRGRHRVETETGSFRVFEPGEEIPERLARRAWQKLRGQVAAFNREGVPVDRESDPTKYESEALSRWYSDSDFRGNDPATDERAERLARFRERVLRYAPDKDETDD